MNDAVTDYIGNSAATHREVLEALRQMILAIAPEANEQFKWNRPVYGLEKDFCYFNATKKHVTLGFYEFDKVTTNSNLLEGTGKSMRHVKLTKVEDIAEFRIKSMIEEVLK